MTLNADYGIPLERLFALNERGVAWDQLTRDERRAFLGYVADIVESANDLPINDGSKRTP